MKKIVYIIYILSFSGFCFSQKKDTIDIAFKAKFLTTSIYGIPDKENFIQEIQKQKLEFITYKESNNFVFMKIKFDQKYTDFYRNAHTAWLGNCFFFLAFNKEKSKFYRIGGFDVLDIDEFMMDLSDEVKYLDYYVDERLTKEIPISCIETYYNVSTKEVEEGISLFFEMLR